MFPALVREIGRLIQTSISKQVRLRLELRDDLPFIQADASQIQQVVMNLVINAAEAIGPNDNGTVLVATDVQTVDERSLAGAPGESPGLAPGAYVSLKVEDSGCGMDQATIDRIFEPFFTTKFAGRGLGMAAVQGIVRGHRGTLKVHSNPGEGTTITVLFPAARETVASRRVAVPSAPVRSALILVIDDEEVIRRTAKFMLERYGYTVMLAENGKEGVELFQVLSEKISAVLLDMTMPVMNGLETFSRLKAIKRDVKVILSSGFNEVETVRPFSGTDLAGFLQKPYSSAALREKIAAVLRAPVRQRIRE